MFRRHHSNTHKKNPTFYLHNDFFPWFINVISHYWPFNITIFGIFWTFIAWNGVYCKNKKLQNNALNGLLACETTNTICSLNLINFSRQKTFLILPLLSEALSRMLTSKKWSSYCLYYHTIQQKYNLKQNF